MRQFSEHFTPLLPTLVFSGGTPLYAAFSIRMLARSPSLRQLVPRMGKLVPSTGQLVPTSGQLLPMSGQRVPNLGQSVPNLGRSVQHSGQVVPSFGLVRWGNHIEEEEE